jgi:hypothetical protein
MDHRNKLESLNQILVRDEKMIKNNIDIIECIEQAGAYKNEQILINK